MNGCEIEYDHVYHNYIKAQEIIEISSYDDEMIGQDDNDTAISSPDAICPILISKRVLLASSIELMFLLLGRAKLVKGQGQSKAGERSGQSKPGERSSSTGTPSISKSITSLEAMGVRVFGLDEPLVGNAKEEVSWDTIAGYDQQKRYLKCGALTVNYF
ncbi:uncharacterized protein LOC110701793 [Chenopodium quinoa]|uniref:uncharacterized protein LOC110701793 n=1 Tax=Chenopodium quinoa TaxID=63459 RepID=UPI000B7954EB|nr:uncharacterized protein LOC110701793 [Chenopodium quinoa]